jgi:hypothetical protein
MKIKYLCVFVGLLLSTFVLAEDASNARSLFVKKSGSSFSNSFENKEKDASKLRSEKKPSLKESNSEDSKNETNKISYIGLSAAVYQLNSANQFEMVSPTKVFKTGDRVRVLVTSNKAGYITSTAINPQGEVSIIGEQKVEADQTVTVPQKGSIKFDGKTGVEELLFTLSAKSGVGRNLMNATPSDKSDSYKNACKKNNLQRDLVVDDASNDFFLMSNDGKCIEQNGKSRDLIVESDQDVDYGVVPESQFAKGNILGLKLYLKHK